MATEQDAARDRVLAARAAFDQEYQALAASTREAVDIPAKIRRSPAKVAAVAAGAGFIVLRGPQRVIRGTRRLLFGKPAPLPKAMLPEEIEKTLKMLGDDGEKVRGTLERDFADYAKQAQKNRRGLMLALLLPLVRPALDRGAKAGMEWLTTPGRIDAFRAQTEAAVKEGRATVERAGAAVQERVDQESGGPGTPSGPA